MKKCPNCGSRITCGCQKRTAIDGKTKGCSKCIASLNAKLMKPRKPGTTHRVKI